MEVITTVNAKEVKAKVKYHEVSSSERVGGVGKRDCGAQCKRTMLSGTSIRARKTITKPSKTATAAKNPWILNRGRTR